MKARKWLGKITSTMPGRTAVPTGVMNANELQVCLTVT